MDFSKRSLRGYALFISITLFAVNSELLVGQELASSLPPDGVGQSSSSLAPDGDGQLPYPAAVVVPGKNQGTPVKIESTNPQTRVGSLYTLDKDVVITYGDRIIKADHVEYDSDAGEVRAAGHLEVTGGENLEYIRASRGEFNVQTQTGRFYDVMGSVGLPKGSANRPATGPVASPVAGPMPGSRQVYDNGNPFLFSGRIVIKRGPAAYDVIDGSVTSCQLAKPDWVLDAALFSIDGPKAKAKNSVFRLLNVPLLYLPYVTHPVDPQARQSGLLIPTLGYSGGHKGFVLGEEIYVVLGRSMDLTFGSTYYSERGFAENGTFRYRGLGQNFVTARFSALQDRGFTPTGGVYTNQGGQDMVLKARYDVAPRSSAQTRLVADAEYLSSYIYREAFTENFNQAVTTDILSTLYAVRNADGYSASFRADRYQGLKPAPQTAAQAAAGDAIQNSQVTIFHIPALALTTTDHMLGGGAASHVIWNLDTSIGGLKRTQPAFTTSGVGRLDIHPEVAVPFTLGGLHLRPSLAVRETAYTRSRLTPFVPGTTPVETAGGYARTDLEAGMEIRPAVLERTFDTPFTQRVFGGEVKHTIEPEASYRFVTGINNFGGVLRFDDNDVVSNTNQLEYGVTQRLFLKSSHLATKVRACKATETPDAVDDNLPDDDPNGKPASETRRCNSREFFSWRLAQRVYFDDSFGGAVANGRRNILESTLSFSGIAFLTQPRSTSPLISRIRVRPSERLDFEWDFDYDTKQGKFTTSNIFTDVHQGNIFAGFSYAGLSAPGRFDTNGTQNSTTEFSQMRVLAGYGMPTKAGLSVAANAGIDLNLGSFQYASVETSYNWNCCGFSAEYRKYQLGSVRNEPAYKFNFTLANIGTAGNLRRAERLF